MDEFETKKYDVVVVGAGGAGLRAAIAAADYGSKVALVTKSLLGKAHTVMAEGGIAAALGNEDKRDNWKVHFRDTIRGSKNLANWEMAKIHAEKAPERVKELEKWGAVFDRSKEGKISQRNFGGHRYPRLAHVGDRTGLEIIRTLQDYAVHKENIDVFMEFTVTTLLKSKSTVAGVLAYNRSSGNFKVFESGAVILATGGIGKAYRVTSNSWEYTGDGHALAHLAGADLIDMEFVQFHPTGMVWPPSVKGTLVTEGVRGEGGILINSEGKRFMFDYIPEVFAAETAKTEEEADAWLKGEEGAMRPPELLTRDVVARAIMAEVKEGRGSPHGGAFLDIASRQPADYIQRKLPSMYHQFKELATLDITKEPMEVGPTTHYMMGGIKVDAGTAASTVGGLYAAGEAAAGMHGANRLGGNSLSDLLVFGKIAGQSASNYAQKNAHTSPHGDEIKRGIDDALKPFEDGTENPYAIHEELQEVMEAHAGIVRTGEGLEKGIQKLEKIRKKLPNLHAKGDRQYNPGWHLCLDLNNMIITSLALANAALERKESRGAHTRLDYPNYDDDLGKVNLIIRPSPEGLSVIKSPLSKMPDDLNDYVLQEAI
ncbi:MAG TPA: fumarate reductase/succinate dehydrogenase flavoprotein subunit [Marine Group III euryarchaeote]|uniref:Fumarate reductase/succinate dehydrogenase flavoprotein subunit n=1 Tax=Marine Group III euryarchaeote TaxID=2173149 RepID=A0A7J4GTY2_9ARCH|nr:fumarate reductase/succinate dehydrogenase flavoprotein subunit [Marine Group III euryarchaeote]